MQKLTSFLLLSITVVLIYIYIYIYIYTLVDQEIKLYLQNIRKNNNTTNNNNTVRINLYHRNQIHYNYKLDEQATTNIIKRLV